jgi:uridine phosphorylase
VAEHPDAPILEFDPDPAAVLDPSHIHAPKDMPQHAVLCFFQEVIEKVVGEGAGKRAHLLGSEIGDNPVWEMDVDGRRLAVAHPGVGAPLAAAFLEELITIGCRTFVACGAAGSLVPEQAMGHVVVPEAAIRDEGTSYHYLPAGRAVAASPRAVESIEATLRARGVPYVLGKTWTTDGIYRETRGKVERRVREGCLTVEMEAAAFFAVAAFRGVTFGQLLYAGDDLSGDTWDDRGWLQQRYGVREELFWIAAEACLAI